MEAHLAAPAARSATGVPALRAALAAARFDEPTIRTLLDLRGRFVGANRARRGLQLLRAAGRSPLETLVRLFVLGEPVERSDAAAALHPLTLAEAARLDLVRPADDAVAPLVSIAPFDGLLIVADAVRWDDAHAPEDVVPGLSESAVSLARLTPRRQVGLALDLGTGCGVHALRAARHADHVIATDVNPRALAYARLNLELNEVVNVELRLGSMFDPVDGLAFDLVVSNPPYVVGPDRAYLYRDGGDGFCGELVRGACTALAEGGVAVTLAGWTDEAGDPWRPPQRWLADGGCDAVVCRTADMDLLGNAWMWTEDAASTMRWRDALRAAGATRVAYGAVALRRSAGGRRVATVDLPGRTIPVAGAHLVRMLENLEWLRRRDGRVSPRAVAPAPGLELHETEQLGTADDPPRPRHLALRRGIAFMEEATPELLAALRDPDGAAGAELEPTLVRLLELGLLVPRN